MIFVCASSWIYLIGVVPYFKDCLKWRTIPHVYSQFVWSIVFFISTTILILWEEYLAAVPWIIATVFNTIWFIFSLKWRKKIPITFTDKISTVLALLLIVFSLVTKDFFHTIALAILIDFLAFIPTIRKWWILPWSDTIITWFLASIQYWLMLFTFTEYSFQNIGFWVYNIVATLFFFFLVFFRRWYLKWWKSIFE